MLIDDFKEPVLCLIPAVLISACMAGSAGWIYETIKGVRGRRNRNRKNDRLFWTLFLAYLFVIGYMAFFSREPGSRKAVSLVLFETWGSSFRMHAYFIENIIMFLPLGAFLPVLFHRERSGWRCVLTRFACSCAIELMQHITQRGYMQLDDVMTNTAGTFVGWLAWRGFDRLRGRFCMKQG